MESIVRQVDLFAERAEDFVIVIKITAIYLFIKSHIAAKKPITNLNLVCRPLPQYTIVEKFALISGYVTTIFIDLINSIEKFETV